MSLRVGLVNDTLIIRITNTTAAERAVGAAGIGLKNVRERIDVQFEGRASLAVTVHDTEWVSEVTMPAIRESPALMREVLGRREAASGAAGAGLMNVIIVDDEAAGRRTLREYCEAEPDLKVVGEFGDPVAALAAIRAQPPELLFLDIQMDQMNGIDLARSLDPAQLPSLVYVTAYDTYALEAFEVSAVDYLLKPFDQERFRKTLARVRPRHLSSGARGASIACWPDCWRN